MKVCDTCGNEIPDPVMQCPFCDAPQNAPPIRARSPSVQTVNIKEGLPTVEDGRSRLDHALCRARQNGTRVVRIIHGYGSTGTGGRLREMVRGYLQKEQRAGRIRLVVCGDDYGRGHATVREWMKRFPDLKRCERTDTANPGITFVELGKG